MSKKFVVVLNKTYQADQLLSALGHVTAGLSANSSQRETMNFVVYRDKDGGAYPNISAWPFIVLRGKSGELKRLRSELLAANLDYACYLDTMISGGSDAQMAATTTKTGDELQILALATFGEGAKLDPLTKKFSLWRPSEPAGQKETAT
jgi:hypothetical protein